MDAVPAPEAIEVWPDNAQSLDVFLAMQTQWERNGMTGRYTGMRYVSLPVVMGFSGVPKAARRQVFDDIRIMESAVLEQING